MSDWQVTLTTGRLNLPTHGQGRSPKHETFLLFNSTFLIDFGLGVVETGGTVPTNDIDDTAGALHICPILLQLVTVTKNLCPPCLKEVLRIVASRSHIRLSFHHSPAWEMAHQPFASKHLHHCTIMQHC